MPALNATIRVPFEFRACHGLLVRPEMHWHVYRVVVALAGPVSRADGFVCDMGLVHHELEQVLGSLDGATLNDNPHLKAMGEAGSLAATHPTCEAMAHAFANALQPRLNKLKDGARLTRVDVELRDEPASSTQAREYGWASVTL